MTSDDEFLEQQLNLEIESITMNRLTDLGNQAIKLGLIAGHGYRGGQYEILRQGQFVLLSPIEAETYLRELIASVTS